MKLWLLEQNVNNTYDTYDSFVVAAETYDEARVMLPGKAYRETDRKYYWAPVDAVVCTLLAEAAPGIESGVICASFNAS